MYGWETRMLLKHYLDRGVSKAELDQLINEARELQDSLLKGVAK